MDDLKDAQDKYNDLVNDRQDDLINNMYDDEIDRLQKEQEDKMQELEDKWSDSKIAEVVANALGSGVIKCSLYIVICIANSLNCWKPLKPYSLQHD